MESLTVVGGGLVGSLFSIYLAKRGYQVDLLERRPDIRKEEVGGGRSINLAVSVRGLNALREMGLESLVLEESVPMRGRMIHPLKGELAFQRYGKDDSECIHSISRTGLNKTLLQAAEEAGVKIHFKERVVDVDLQKQSLVVKNEGNGKTESRSFNRVFGTDGSASALRHALQRLPNFRGTEEELNYGYKELVIPALPNRGFAMEKHALHIWPRGSYMLIALPNFDGSYTCTLFLPFKGKPGFDTLPTKEAVHQFFSEQFPDTLKLIPGIEDQFFENPTGHMVTVKVAPWHFEDKVLLLGDASHAIVPFFGQGMNAGFEDIVLFNRLCEKEPSWAKRFSTFSETRKPDTDAIADMAVENFVEMRDKVGDRNFLMRKEVEQMLQKMFPEEYRSRYSLVTFSQVPYSVASNAGQATDKILNILCKDIERADQVDLTQAETCIREELIPVLKRWL